MKSVTKNKLTEDDIKKMALKHFSDSKIIKITELVQGMFNSAYIVEGTGKLEGGVVLKAGPLPEAELLIYEKEIMKTEVDVLKLLSGADVPVPEVLAADFSKEDMPFDYFFMNRLEGSTWKEMGKKVIKKSKPELMHKLGKFNAEIHSVKGDFFGYIKDDAHYKFDSWSGAFSCMMEDILLDGEKRGNSLPYQKIRDIVSKYRDVLDEVKEPKLVSFDIWAGNVFVKEEKDKLSISGIIDFERAFYGDQYADFTSAMQIFSDVENEPEFVEGYEEITGSKFTVSENDRIRMNLYRLYMAIILNVETYRYGRAYRNAVKIYTKVMIKRFLNKLN